MFPFGQESFEHNERSSQLNEVTTPQYSGIVSEFNSLTSKTADITVYSMYAALLYMCHRNVEKCD